MVEVSPLSNTLFSSKIPHSLKPVQTSSPAPIFLPIRHNNRTTTTAGACSTDNVDPTSHLLLPRSIFSENPNSLNSNTSNRTTTKDRREAVRLAWEKLVRWSRSWRSKAKTDVLERTNKRSRSGGPSVESKLPEAATLRNLVISMTTPPNGGRGSGSGGAHVLVFPFPAPGHIIPLLDLTRLLLAGGLTVTVLVTPNHLSLLQPLLSAHDSNSINPLVLSPPDPPNASTPSIPKEDVPTFSDGGSNSLPGIVSHACRLGALYDPILRWFNSHPSPPVAILSDFFLGWTHHLAANLGLQRLVFWPSGALTASITNHLWRNTVGDGDTATTISFPGIPNSPAFPRWQISNSFRDFKEGDKDYEFFRDGMVANTKSWGLVVNSFTGLEGAYVDHLKRDLGHSRVWAVGPLLPPLDDVNGPTNRGGPSSAPTDELMAWLDSEPGDSVVYICFGSRVVLTSKQVEVLAAAIEGSGVHFIWCVKKEGRGNTEGDAGFIPDGFEDRVGAAAKKRGFVIRGWAPQVAILRHRAVGAFVTHCGWNSVLEGIAAGVLMLTWPRGADQFINATLLVDQLGVGIRACEGGEENVPDLDELTGLLTESVGGNRAEREGVVRLHKEAWNAVNGGSSARDLDKLVKELNLLRAST